MTKQEKQAAIVILIEAGRDAARFTNTISEQIAAICGVTQHPDQFALDYIYTGTHDVSAQDAARWLLREGENNEDFLASR